MLSSEQVNSAQRFLDRNLSAFYWLDIKKWNGDTIFNDYQVNGLHMCKVCDEWFKPNERDKHVKKHVKQELDRRARVKEEERKLRAEERGEEYKQPSQRRQFMSDNANTKSEVVQKVEQALTNSDGLTLSVLSDTTGVPVATIRATVKSMEKDSKVVVAGQYKSGGRGRPAAIYKLA